MSFRVRAVLRRGAAADPGRAGLRLDDEDGVEVPVQVAGPALRLQRRHQGALLLLAQDREWRGALRAAWRGGGHLRLRGDSLAAGRLQAGQGEHARRQGAARPERARGARQEAHAAWRRVGGHEPAPRQPRLGRRGH
eukprot:724478-Prymnesium_polylepis.1